MLLKISGLGRLAFHKRSNKFCLFVIGQDRTRSFGSSSINQLAWLGNKTDIDLTAKQQQLSAISRIGLATAAGTSSSGNNHLSADSFNFSNNNQQNNFKDDRSLLSDQDILHEPERERFGVTKALAIIFAGAYFGAWIAMMGANMLEDLEIFVNDDDDDDD